MPQLTLDVVLVVAIALLLRLAIAYACGKYNVYMRVYVCVFACLKVFHNGILMK